MLIALVLPILVLLLYLDWNTSGTVTMTCVSAKNGILALAGYGGLTEAFFVKDNFRICYGTTGWEMNGGWSISKRNLKPANFHSGTSFNLLSATVNALEMKHATKRTD